MLARYDHGLTLSELAQEARLSVSTARDGFHHIGALRMIRKSGYASDNKVITFGLRFVAISDF